MTAPGTSTPQPGRAAFAADRGAVVLWSLLLVGLLALLPCAGTAKAAAEPLPTPLPLTGAKNAAQPGPAEHGHAHAASPQAPHRQPPLTWCAADGDRPGPGSCSSHAFCGPEAQLPNAPPQPAAAAASLLQPVPVPALPCGRPTGALTVPDHAPDLHVLQVQRS